MKSFNEFRSNLNESVQDNAIKIIVAALKKDGIKYTLPANNNKTLSIIKVEHAMISINGSGNITYAYKGNLQDLVFKKPEEIANKIVDLLNLEGIGDSAFGVF